MLLGDSFTLIYSSSALHWGLSSGLGEHLALHLNRPIDVIAMNGSAATGVRQELYRAAVSGRLNSKRVLIYEFTVRDLVQGDWAPIPLPPAPPREAPRPGKTEAAAPQQLVVRGEIEFLSAPLDPSNAPYTEALQYAKIRVTAVESGVYRRKSAIVAFYAMKERKLLPGGMHSVGDAVRLRLTPLSEAPAAVRGMQRSDQTSDYDLPPMLVTSELQ